jgi:hypothetical protein
MRHRRLTHSAALGLVVAALAAPTAAAQHQDLRSPDTRDAATPHGNPWQGLPSPTQDLRSPDARDAARQPSTVQVRQQDLRSPDTRDHAGGRGTFNAPQVTVVRLPRPAPAADDGIAWGDAGIGAGALFGLLALALGGTAALVHRRHLVQRQTAPTA